MRPPLTLSSMLGLPSIRCATNHPARFRSGRKIELWSHAKGCEISTWLSNSTVLIARQQSEFRTPTVENKDAAPNATRDFWSRLLYALAAQRFQMPHRHRPQRISRRRFSESRLQQKSLSLLHHQLPLSGIVAPLVDAPAALWLLECRSCVF